MALFDEEDIFIGLTNAEFLAKIDKMSKPDKDKLYLKAKDRYYDGDEIMTDWQFDTLEEHLKTIKSKVVEGNVGGGSNKGGKLTEKHLTPMLSLDKIQVNDETDDGSIPAVQIQEILAWFKGTWPLEATPKYDGNAVECQYANGQLVKAVTRGKRGLGKDVTQALKHLVPPFIGSKKTLEIRGEVCIPLDVFVDKYHESGDGEDNRYKNARNFIGGMLNDDSIPTEKLKDSVYVAYSAKVVEIDGKVRHVENTMENLQKLGFNKDYAPPVRIAKTPGDIHRIYNEFKEYRANGTKMQLDGIVFKTMETERAKFGEGNKHPKWATAIKFPSQIARTTLSGDVVWQVGSTGKLTPVAILDPVELDGSVVTRASLYNKGKMEEKKLFKGAVVDIKKSGDIIPAIVKVVKPSPDAATRIAQQDFFPTCCPECQSTLEIDNQHLTCVNPDCVGKAARGLDNSLKDLRIKGIGKSTCADLFLCDVKDIFDFFDPDKMNETNLTNEGVFKEGSSTLNEVLELPNQIKEIELHCVIMALNIPNVGQTYSKKLAKYFAGQPVDWKGVSMAAVNPFMSKTSQETHLLKKLVQILRDRGVKIIMPTAAATNAIGFEMTGSPKDAGFAKKEDFVALMMKNGYEHKKLSQGAKVLLTDSYSATSNKMKDATKRGVQILTYEDMLEKLDA